MPPRMRGWVLARPAPADTSPLELRELPVPEPGRMEVRLRVSTCGVCHTDLHTVEGELPLPRLPLVPGHQVVGVIDRLGPGAGEVTGLAKGMRVGVPWLYSACGVCEFCQQGQENLCRAPRFTGYHVDGGYAEYLVAPAPFVVPLPQRYDDVHAAPLLCAGIIGYRSLRVADVRPGERLGLFGFGASAHLALQLAVAWGCEVAVFSRQAAHQELARQLGAAWAGSAGTGAPGEPGGGRPPFALDRAVSFAPAGWLIPRALEALRPGGTLAINAIHVDRVPEMPYALLYGERRLVTVANATRRDAREFMALADRLPLQVHAQALPMFVPGAANDALRRLKQARVQGALVLTTQGDRTG